MHPDVYLANQSFHVRQHRCARCLGMIKAMLRSCMRRVYLFPCITLMFGRLFERRIPSFACAVQDIINLFLHLLRIFSELSRSN